MKVLRLLKPETTRIELSDEDWIDIKVELSAGEQRRVNTAGFESMHQKEGERPVFDLSLHNVDLRRVTAYLTDWSLVDDKQNKMKISQPMIEALPDDVFEIISNAISAHVEKRDAAKKALKS